jgi:hypothetical protein
MLLEKGKKMLAGFGPLATALQYGTTYSSRIDMRDANSVCFVHIRGEDSAGNCTFTVERCDSDGSNVVAIEFKTRINGGALVSRETTGYLSDSGSTAVDEVTEIYVDARQLAGSTHVRVKMVATNTTEVAWGMIAVVEPRASL